jgi:outer membrane protein assembly factor BamB
MTARIACAILIAAGCGGARKQAPAASYATPESVLHDPVADVYLVSNIDGEPDGKDGKGFISRLEPAGKLELRWIDGLNAPKGSAIIGDVLYVADIDVVRMFDRASGAAKGEIAFEGAQFLNDLSAAGTMLWVSDTYGNAIYRVDTAAGNAITKVVQGEDLGKPNGLAAHDGRVTVVTFGSGEIYDLDDSGTISDRRKLPKGQLDGVVVDGDRMLVSSWEAKAVYELRGADVKELVSGVESPADIGYDAGRKRILIPLFMKNTVEIR